MTLTRKILNRKYKLCRKTFVAYLKIDISSDISRSINTQITHRLVVTTQSKVSVNRILMSLCVILMSNPAYKNNLYLI